MSRPLRIQYPNALYHITVRGNHKKKIYQNDSDNKLFLSILQKAIFSRNILCYAYCMMPNHFHLVIETPEANLQYFMHDLDGIYTQAYNNKNDKVGHLFQGRYKSFLIEKESYLLEVIRYTVLNPVRAGLVKYPEDWQWSSYRATIGLDKCSKWLYVDWLLEYFKSDKKQRKKEFVEFVHEGISERSPFEKAKSGNVLGSQQFKDWCWEQTEDLFQNKEISRHERIIGRPSLFQIFEYISESDLRNKAMIFARFCCGYSVVEIANYLKLSPSLVSRKTIRCSE
ncbi:MAG: transposase of ISGbem_B [uncultured bacterium]|uniref:Transposase IS200-like domain-containing protein n=1 Tax=Candidatus Uhrbacteria bacterium GW2011_GWC1_41_20 TaxID=1618983 RepID=A0A0G0XMW5_9BACT|nr:MAG: transposase of ISGbem_B [uncultured bacterium]KKR21339.1 MAG: hypothetical protein UT52_C0030G0003 [Candidatus Uhrbacteria bacterium GW2011_GWE1_39_46]KKR63053.1 MAG: hypothetical protein UU04_C0029G0002 [Candidatus Uhrbacteria bacterium GW2011_GWC2_40_450]KKR89320.1 MAG: hypothetical protein UU36_C0034G0002 [Candidatus Uhrbacteria bacterium GW2011_GWE2_41_1153]KKR89376.1 MAG: hypothetical protein UU40_C0029G0003 [Candidatus Uhrbacteria bacterium GW2011_GWD2_41_121]KKR95513.1 MAG: hypo